VIPRKQFREFWDTPLEQLEVRISNNLNNKLHDLLHGRLKKKLYFQLLYVIRLNTWEEYRP